jgi:4-amino-4-deoxy-L-arabinose transferase-like glycosyltransferase
MTRSSWLRYCLGLILLTVLIRLPALVHPSAIDDETVYSVVAHEMLEGGLPYRDAIERKPPLLFWTYALVFRVAGKYNWPALHAVGIAWVLLTMAGLYLIGYRLFDRRTGLVAALLYSVYQPWLEWRTLAFNGEVLMNLPLVWGAALALRRSGSAHRPELLAAGSLFSLAFLLKQPAAIAAVPFGLYLLLPRYRADRGLALRHSLAHGLLFAAGFVGILGLAAIILREQGILREAVFWTITHHAPAYVDWRTALLTLPSFLVICAPLIKGGWWAGRAAGPAGDPFWGRWPAELRAVSWWVAASAVGAGAGLRFYSHYYIQLIPPLALLAAPYGAGLLSGSIRPPAAVFQAQFLRRWIAVTVLGLFALHAIGLRSRLGWSDAASHVRTNSLPDDRIFIWGQSAGMYLSAERRPASRYIMTFPLTGLTFGSRNNDLDYDTSDQIVPGAWDTLAADLRRHPPSFILDTDVRRRVAKYPISRFPWLADLVAREYHLDYQAVDAAVYRKTVEDAPLP